jgi:hypothetical protein
MRRTFYRPRRRDERSSPRATVVYAVVWLVAAAAAVGLVFAVFGGGDDDTVSVPPVRETELVSAAGRNRCVLRSTQEGERLNPAVDGPAGGRPARPGFYDKPVATAELTAAVRRGIIVIQFRQGLDDEAVDALKTLQTAIPSGTIVAPNATGMPFQLAVVGYRRLLGCPRFTTRALDAVQLFRGRFLGSGPES